VEGLDDAGLCTSLSFYYSTDVQSLLFDFSDELKLMQFSADYDFLICTLEKL